MAKRPTRGTKQRRGRYALWAAFALALLPARGALAQATGDAAAAEELFRQAKALIAQGAYDQACPKLAESHRLDPAGGTALTLALCYRAQGKTASAWASFQEALSRAKQDRRPDRERVARREIASLEPRLSRLRVSVEPSASALPGFRVLRDGKPIGAASYGVASPVDPGRHEVTAGADGHSPFQRTIDVGASADTREVLVPALEPEAKPAPPGEGPAPPPPAQAGPAAPAATKAGPAGAAKAGPPWGVRALGYGGIGAGAAALGVALYYGYRVKLDRDEARERCPSSPCGDKEGIERNESARDNATIANVSAALGLVALGAGLYVTLSAPSGPKAPSAKASVMLAPGPGGASLVGSF